MPEILDEKPIQPKVEQPKDVVIKLDDTDATALIQSRIAKRNAQILANHAAAMLLRQPPQKEGEKLDDKAKKDAEALVLTKIEDHDTLLISAKAKGPAPAFTPAEVLHDPVAGTLTLKVKKMVPISTKPSHVESERLKLNDVDAQDAVNLYAAACTAIDECFDLRRKIAYYLEVNPPVAVIDPEKGPQVAPEPKELQDLRTALKAKEEDAQTNQTALSAIFSGLLEGKNYEGVRHDIKTGELVLSMRAGK